MKQIALAVLKMLGIPEAKPPKAAEPEPVHPTVPAVQDRALAQFLPPVAIDLTKPLAGQVLLAFNTPGSEDGKTPPVELLLTFRDATTSLLFLGGTGTGKTTGGGVPLHYLNEPLKFVARYKLAHRFQALYTTQEQREAAEDTLAALRSRETGAYVFSMLHFAKDPSAKKGKTTDIITQVGVAPPTKVSMVTTDDAKIFEQYAWHVASLLTITRPFYENPKLRRAFCADVATGIDWFDLVYVQQQFIVLDMPTHTYGEAALFVAEILRMQYHDVIRGAQDYRDKLTIDGKRVVYGVDRFTGELHDEFQKILTADGSSMDDSNWIDISRSYGHINIVLTQSITSLHGKAKNHFAVEAFVQNCCNVVCFPTIDERTLSYAETLAGRKASTVREHLVTPQGPRGVRLLRQRVQERRRHLFGPGRGW